MLTFDLHLRASYAIQFMGNWTESQTGTRLTVEIRQLVVGKAQHPLVGAITVPCNREKSQSDRELSLLAGA